MAQTKPQESTPQSTYAKRAMEMKAESPKPQHPVDRTADQGMNPMPNTQIAPSGALNAEGQRPVLERSRKAR